MWALEPIALPKLLLIHPPKTPVNPEFILPPPHITATSLRKYIFLVKIFRAFGLGWFEKDHFIHTSAIKFYRGGDL